MTVGKSTDTSLQFVQASVPDTALQPNHTHCTVQVVHWLLVFFNN